MAKCANKDGKLPKTAAGGGPGIGRNDWDELGVIRGVTNKDFRDFFENCVRLGQEERKNHRSVTLHYVNRLLNAVHDMDGTFDKTPIKVGSSCQGLEVGKPDEFDYNVRLTKIKISSWSTRPPPYDLREPQAWVEADDTGYCSVRILPNHVETICKGLWVNVGPNGGELSPLLVRQAFKLLLKQAVKLLKLEEPASLLIERSLALADDIGQWCTKYYGIELNKNVEVKERYNGPAITITIKDPQLDQPVDVDLSPTIDCKLLIPKWVRWPHPNVRWPSPDKKKKVGKAGVNLVPKGKDKWFISYNNCEKELRRNIDQSIVSLCHTKCHRIMKKLKDDNWCKNANKGTLTSYHLKNIMFFECESYPNDDDWKDSEMLYRISSMLSKLVTSLRRGHLPMFMDNRVNLLADKDKKSIGVVDHNIMCFWNDPRKFLRTSESLVVAIFKDVSLMSLLSDICLPIKDTKMIKLSSDSDTRKKDQIRSKPKQVSKKTGLKSTIDEKGNKIGENVSMVQPSKERLNLQNKKPVPVKLTPRGTVAQGKNNSEKSSAKSSSKHPSLRKPAVKNALRRNIAKGKGTAKPEGAKRKTTAKKQKVDKAKPMLPISHSKCHLPGMTGCREKPITSKNAPTPKRGSGQKGVYGINAYAAAGMPRLPEHSKVSLVPAICISPKGQSIRKNKQPSEMQRKTNVKKISETCRRMPASMKEAAASAKAGALKNFPIKNVSNMTSKTKPNRSVAMAAAVGPHLNKSSKSLVSDKGLGICAKVGNSEVLGAYRKIQTKMSEKTTVAEVVKPRLKTSVKSSSTATRCTASKVQKESRDDKATEQQTCMKMEKVPQRSKGAAKVTKKDGSTKGKKPDTSVSKNITSMTKSKSTRK